MEDTPAKLGRAARQLMETESLLGGDFMPKGRQGLPEVSPPPAEVARPAEKIEERQMASDEKSLGATMTAQQKTQALAELNEQLQGCCKCGLGTTRTNLVFGEGNPAAELVFVGEAPGEDEDLQGRPFVGRSGQLLDKMIVAMGLTRDDVYICNVVKCRPPGNRTPTPEEAATCFGYLARQLEIIAPKVIVTLGNPATHTLLQTKVGITQLRGQWQSLPPIAPGLGGTAVMPTFHPAFVLRYYNEETRGKVWSDLKKVLERLGRKLPGAK